MDVLPSDLLQHAVSFLPDRLRPRAVCQRWLACCWRARRSLLLHWRHERLGSTLSLEHLRKLVENEVCYLLRFDLGRGIRHLTINTYMLLMWPRASTDPALVAPLDRA